ncbi:AraC family transcriptional regulator ligand-binding domain-containing protein [Algiphilus sp. NNCM1]|uniref:AraC family transcriptional regulator n=1 Tax=Algiphilus sp. TaxID=1872431 RepID=UPI001CA6B5D9|nr:AraC family transcriptional regulator [Algiphilus sp.]MBY8965133.1 AraC family transcriptional regulator ligand-binding domain-containing protein [Algiphilus acroporae]MCI5102707.1 AraC family transcriptional regulator [Algiphilus sp.]
MTHSPALHLAVSFWSPLRLAYGLLPMLELLDRYALDADRLLQEAGIARFGVMDPSYTITVQQEIAFHTSCFLRIPSAALSLEVAREYGLRGFSVLGLAMQASKDVLSMLRLIARYPRLAWGMFDGELTLDDRGLRIAFRPQPRLGRAEGFFAERDLACALVMAEEATQQRFPLESVHFRHACTGDPAGYEAFFGCPVHFNAERTGIRAAHDAALFPLPQADARICAFYTAQCAVMARSIDQPFRYTEAVRNRLLESAVMPDLPALAQRMYLTERTLQRRLRAEGVSFSQVLREARRERAEQLLSESRASMEQIATTLGFGDAVAFSHAFKSWTGQSPLRWRRKATAHAAAPSAGSAC